MSTTTITGLPDATTPLTGNERVPMDQAGTTKDATTQDIADLALADADAARTTLGLNTDDSPTFAGLTLTGLLTAPHIHGTLAGDVYVHVKNTSGGTLAANTAVYVTGSVGDTDRVEVAACDPTDPAKMPAIGLLKTALANNAEGDAVILGELRPTNSSGYTLGDELYVGAGGALVSTIPASGQVQRVGSVARVQSETGTIVVGIGAGMARVGFSGSYNDLSGKPTLGTAAALDVGTTAGDVVQLDGDGKLPAVDGSQLTNLPSGGTPGGSDGQIQFNSSGSFAGIPNSSVDGATGAVTLARLIAAANGAASAPPLALTGTWFTGGTTTTTKPALLIEPTGTTSTAWSANGTGLGVNAPSGFTGNLLDLQVDGTSKVYADASAFAHIGTVNSINAVGSAFGAVYARQGTSVGSSTIRCYIGAGFGVGVVGNESNHPLSIRTNNVNRLILDTVGSVQVATALTVATLPGTPVVGMIARVTDGDSGLGFGATVVNSGGGATPYLCWYNGSNWTVLGA